jgi:hypothetical protein
MGAKRRANTAARNGQRKGGEGGGVGVTLWVTARLDRGVRACENPCGIETAESCPATLPPKQGANVADGRPNVPIGRLHQTAGTAHLSALPHARPTVSFAGSRRTARMARATRR